MYCAAWSSHPGHMHPLCRAQAMITLVSVDPGLRDLGLAVFKDGILSSAFLVRNPVKAGGGAQAWLAMALEARTMLSGEVDLLVHELMQVYAPGQQKGSQADLIELAGVSGAMVGVFNPARAVSYLPREHKGQLPKEVHHKRVLAALSPTERAILDATECPPSLMHNVLDAVGIGLFQLGRIKGTVRPR